MSYECQHRYISKIKKQVAEQYMFYDNSYIKYKICEMIPYIMAVRIEKIKYTGLLVGTKKWGLDSGDL